MQGQQNIFSGSRRKRCARVGFGLLLCIFCLMISTRFVLAAPGKDANVVSPEEIGESFYDTQTALTAYVNNVIGVNGNDKHDNNRVEDPQSVGNAGAYLGYGDEARGFSSYLMSSLTHGTTTSTYDAWLKVTDSLNGNEVYAYARFGHVLADAGLDEVGSVSKTSMRGFIGMLATSVFLLSQTIPLAFGFALKFLLILNPFGFLSHMSVFQGYWHDAFPTAPQELTAVVDWVCDMFDLIVNEITWKAAVPLLLAVSVSQVLLLKKRFTSVFGNVMKRIVFLVVGLPICAGLYTNVLTDMFVVMTNQTAASQVVASTLIDFESWVDKSRLSIPSNVLIESAPGDTDEIRDISGGRATDDMLNQLRTSAYLLNKTNNPGLSQLPDISSIDSLHFAVSGNLWDFTGNSVSDDFGLDAWQGLTSMREDTEVTKALSDMLWRYTNGSFYRATDFETKYMNELSTTYRDDMGHSWSTSGGSSNDGTVFEMFDRTNEVGDWMERSSVDNQAIFTGGNQSASHLSWVSKPWNVFLNGSLTSSAWNPADTMRFSSTGTYGLSPQSMFNYLSTSFDDTSLMVYSNDNSISENSRQMHYSVNVIGNGALGIAYSLNMIALLTILVIIAFAFSCSIVMRNLKRGFSLMGSIPWALLGAIKAIAQFLSYTVAMILEIVASSFMYLLVSDLLVLVAMAVEEVVTATGANGGITVSILAALGSTSGATPVGQVLGVGLGAGLATLLLVFMLKYRRAWMHIREQGSVKLYKLFTLPETEVANQMVQVTDVQYQPVSFGLQVCRYLA